MDMQFANENILILTAFKNCRANFLACFLHAFVPPLKNIFEHMNLIFTGCHDYITFSLTKKNYKFKLLLSKNQFFFHL